MPTSQKGFATFFIILLILVSVFIAAGAYFLIRSHGKQSFLPIPAFNQIGLTQAEKDGKNLSHGACVGNEKPKLTTLPMRMEDFSMIIPYGLVIDDHITPIDHQYFSPTEFQSPRDKYEVMAMADATIVEIEPRVKPEYTEYRMIFSMSCTLFYYYDLVTSLTPELKAQVGRSVNIPVKSGQVIGKIGGQTLDFAVWDMDVILKGFIVPEHYLDESWKIHTVDPLDYYTDDLKKQALSKYIRTVPPVSGRIDYDIDGKLVGNWFIEGSHNYEGIRPGGPSEDYYRGQLAIVPNHIDPSALMISFGDFNGEFRQLTTTKDAPDPTQVGVEEGMIKYELFEVDYAKENGESWDRFSFAQNIKVSANIFPRGCVLFQMLSARSLKMEAFPNISCLSVSTFSSKAKIYER